MEDQTRTPLSPKLNPGVPITLQLAGLELVAFAISGLASYVMAPGLDAVFDLGHCPFEAVRLRNVFLSHVHQDHAGAVFRHHALRAMQGQRSARIFVPHESLAGMRDVFRAFERLEGRPPEDLDRLLHPVRPGDGIGLSKRYRVVAFDVVHRIASRGYTVYERRSKLREAYRGLPGPEIGAARARGETIEDTLELPRLTYIGDSTVETLRRHPEVGHSEVLFLEATHLGDTPRGVAAKYGHTHLDELVELWQTQPEALASRHIVLKHFSVRYTREEILAAVAALPEGFRERVTVLI